MNTEENQHRARSEGSSDELKHSEAKLRRIIDTIPVIAWCGLGSRYRRPIRRMRRIGLQPPRRPPRGGVGGATLERDRPVRDEGVSGIELAIDPRQRLLIGA